MRRTIYFARKHNEAFTGAPQLCRTQTKQEKLKEAQREIESSERHTNNYRKPIEDKVADKISEERRLKTSDTHETEQAMPKARVKIPKTEIEKAKAQDGFRLLCYPYASTATLRNTPGILRSFIDKVTVHEKTKESGHYRRTVKSSVTSSEK